MQKSSDSTSEVLGDLCCVLSCSFPLFGCGFLCFLPTLSCILLRGSRDTALAYLTTQRGHGTQYVHVRRVIPTLIRLLGRKYLHVYLP